MTPHHHGGESIGEIIGATLSMLTYIITQSFITDELIIIGNTILCGVVGFAVGRCLKKIFPEKK